MFDKGQCGIGIHIGLNRVDAEAYGGWDGALAGCLNDARDMEAITTSLGYTTTSLHDEEATAQAVLGAISDAAGTLIAGDILVVSFSGHGGQVADQDGDESDALDETIVCYDRMLIDDELYASFQQVPAGVRILMLSDSCHSGTVVRALYARELASPVRVIPAAVLADQMRRRAALYRRAKDAAGGARRTDVEASLILISGCQDNQLSSDGDVNGLFTEKLLAVWADGGFAGGYRAFHQRIVALMPAVQTPNYLTSGTSDPAFEAQKPFTISTSVEPEADPAPEPVAGPWVGGPASIGRDDDPPTFDVHTGSAKYYIFEITSDPALFDASAGGRTRDNFYGSWADPDAPARLTGSSYTLPQRVWEDLRHAEELAFRIGTTPRPDTWDGYAVSTTDDGVHAPTLPIVGTTEPSWVV
jgi:hypothetical protein